MDPAPLPGLSWYWIAFMATVPLVAGHLVALPFWRRNQAIFGNIIGTGIMFASAFGLILREHVIIDRLVQRCLDSGVPCWPEPGPFARYAIYASIALVEVFILFSLSLRVEESVRERDYAPEWRTR